MIYNKCTFLPPISISLLTIVIFFTACTPLESQETYVRVNQVGYLPYEPKFAVVMSTGFLTEKEFAIVDNAGKTVLTGRLSVDSGEFLGFPHNYRADFSTLVVQGVYRVRVGATVSPSFEIGTQIYHPILDSLLRFYKVQRCGDTDPLLHKPCHLKDANIIVGGPDSGGALDLTGGWHDAGDYIKFTLTTSYTVYLLMLTYQIAPHLFPDNDGNGQSDLLDEARIGIDWLMKMHYAPTKLLVQVQDLSDHDVGWRLPENDALTDKRPTYYNPSKMYCGMYAAAMAISAGVFQSHNRPYSDLCLSHAKNVFKQIDTDIPDVSTGPDSMYFDQTAWDNIALAEVELWRTTGDSSYYRRAVSSVKDNDPEYWVSWGDVGTLALARFSSYDSTALKKLESILYEFNQTSDKNAFGYPLTDFPWGSASVQAGVAMIAQLYEYYSGSRVYSSLARTQRDFILGSNPHSVSFITRFGTDYPGNIHHQISQLTGMQLPSVIVGGYVKPSEYKGKHIQPSGDRFSRFQNDKGVYYDNYHDYLSNEPTIGNNAQVLFMLMWYCR